MGVPDTNNVGLSCLLKGRFPGHSLPCGSIATATSFMMHLQLSRAGPSDFDQIVLIAFEAFDGDPLTPPYFGPLDARGRYYAKKGFINEMGEDAASTWIKVEDVDCDIDVDIISEKGESGGKKTEKRIVGAAQWKVFPNYVPSKDDGEEKIPLSEFEYQPTEQSKLDAQTVLSSYFGSRAKEIQEPHVLCALVFVDPVFQGKRVGSMMMSWGHAIADALMLPCWLESSVKGLTYHPKLGYELTSRMKWETESWGTVVSCRMRKAYRGEEKAGVSIGVTEVV